MAGLTQSQAQARLDDWLAADAAVSRGQSYSIEGRSMTRADAKTIRENIVFWDGQVRRLSGNGRGGVRVRLGVAGA